MALYEIMGEDPKKVAAKKESEKVIIRRLLEQPQFKTLSEVLYGKN